jgi:hypothetical protein
MNDINWDEITQSTMDFLLISLINHVNVNLAEDLTEEEKEQLLNVVLNVVSNSLLPDAREYWNEAIFKKAESVKYSTILSDMGFDI